MAKSENQKVKTLFVAKYFLENCKTLKRYILRFRQMFFYHKYKNTDDALLSGIRIYYLFSEIIFDRLHSLCLHHMERAA